MTIPTDHAGWTISSYVAYNEALRLADEKFQAERDRRYTEVNLEREKALRIKDDANNDALKLAKQAQDYKDAKANELREQIAQERGLYATKDDIKQLSDKFDSMHRPVVEFMANAAGKGAGVGLSWSVVLGIVTLMTGLLLIGTFIFSPKAVAPQSQPQIIYVPAPPGSMIPASPPATQPGK